MDNLYKTPASHVSDLTLAKSPPALQRVLNLIKLAFGFSVLQFIVGVIIDPELLTLDGEFSLAFLLFLAGAMLLFWFTLYYLCMLRPVQKCRRRAAYWVFGATLFMAALSLYMEFLIEDPELQVSLLENLLALFEVLVLFYAAYLLTRSPYKAHLTT